MPSAWTLNRLGNSMAPSGKARQGVCKRLGFRRSSPMTIHLLRPLRVSCAYTRVCPGPIFLYLVPGGLGSFPAGIRSARAGAPSDAAGSALAGSHGCTR